MWGAHERCSLEAMKEIAWSFLPSAAAGCPPDPDFSQRSAFPTRATEWTTGIGTSSPAREADSARWGAAASGPAQRSPRLVSSATRRYDRLMAVAARTAPATEAGCLVIADISGYTCLLYTSDAADE